MKTFLFIFPSLLFLNFILLAASEQTYKINGKDEKFISFEDKKIIISANCVLNNQLKDCEAAKAIKSANMKKIEKDALGRNPGALICKEQFKAEVILIRDDKGNETSFCHFKDNTMLASGTLGYWAHKNK